MSKLELEGKRNFKELELANQEDQIDYHDMTKSELFESESI